MTPFGLKNLVGGGRHKGGESDLGTLDSGRVVHYLGLTDTLASLTVSRWGSPTLAFLVVLGLTESFHRSTDTSQLRGTIDHYRDGTKARAQLRCPIGLAQKPLILAIGIQHVPKALCSIVNSVLCCSVMPIHGSGGD